MNFGVALGVAFRFAPKRSLETSSRASQGLPAACRRQDEGKREATGKFCEACLSRTVESLFRRESERFGLGIGGEEEDRRKQGFGLSNRRGLEGRGRGLVAKKQWSGKAGNS